MSNVNPLFPSLEAIIAEHVAIFIISFATQILLGARLQIKLLSVLMKTFFK